MHLGQERSQHCQDGRGRDAKQEDSLAAIFCGKISTRYLSENVAVKEACEDETLSFGIPVKIRDLNTIVL